MSLKDPKNQKALNDFLVEHAPLIQKHINILKSKGVVPPHIDPEDLHFAGFHGLMDALHKYSHDVAGRTSSKEGENVFAKYAGRRIQGKMLDHLAEQDAIKKRERIRTKNLESAANTQAAQAAPATEAPATEAPATPEAPEAPVTPQPISKPTK